ncbi:hypothetical protein TeGR_g6394, partial [Tetraparma gracilis]
MHLARSRMSSLVSTSQGVPAAFSNALSPATAALSPATAAAAPSFRYQRSRALHASVPPAARVCTVSLAPMMEYTDHNFRYLMRLLSPNLTLFTEMITSMALTHTTDSEHYQRRFLTQSPALLANRAGGGGGKAAAHRPFLGDANERESVLQLGGSEPGMLADATGIVLDSQAKYGEYTGINLNCGCPSDKVSLKGAFGAVLMRDPDQ